MKKIQRRFFILAKNPACLNWSIKPGYKPSLWLVYLFFLDGNCMENCRSYCVVDPEFDKLMFSAEMLLLL